MQTKRILFFSLEGLGGAERVMVNISNILKEGNNKVKFVIIHTGITGSKISSLLDKKDIYSTIIKTNQLNLLYNLYRTIKEFQPDIVFSSAMHINQRLLLISPLFRNIKFIVRNENYLFTIPKFKQLTLKYTYKAADKIIGQTSEMVEELINIGLPKNKLFELQNPIDTKLIDSSIIEENPFSGKNRHKIFVACGRLSPQKGFDLLIEAFSMVKNNIPDAKLYILGDTGYGEGLVYDQLQNLIRQYNLQDYVNFTGHVSNPYNYIKNADVFVLSSRWEGLPNVLLESKYIGTPMAAFKCIPVIERIIEDGYSGYTAEAENVRSLAKAMILSSNLPHFHYNTIDNRKEWMNLFNL